MKTHSERGAALITVLLLVAVMSALIAVSFDRLGLALNRERNRSTAEEVRLNLFSAEAIAVQRVTQLQSFEQTRTPGGSNWQDVPVTVPVPGGVVIARLTDGGNCFNLNTLVTNLPDGKLASQAGAIAHFTRLLEVSGVPAATAASIATATSDWIDSDTAPQPGGAEDEVYAGRTPPYRTANNLMHDAGEIRAVAGMTDTLFEKVKPFICALPETNMAGYNVNTLTARQALLIAALYPSGVTPDAVLAALRNRPAAGFATAQDFWTQPSLKAVPASGLVTTQLRLRSSWFRLSLMAQVGDSEFGESVLIDGRFLPARIVRRTLGEE